MSQKHFSSTSKQTNLEKTISSTSWLSLYTGRGLLLRIKTYEHNITQEDIGSVGVCQFHFLYKSTLHTKILLKIGITNTDDCLIEWKQMMMMMVTLVKITIMTKTATTMMMMTIRRQWWRWWMEKTVTMAKLPPNCHPVIRMDNVDDGALPLAHTTRGVCACVLACPPSLPLSEHKVLTDKQNAQIVLDQRISGDQRHSFAPACLWQPLSGVDVLYVSEAVHARV